MKTKLLRYLIAITILSLFIVPGTAFAESNSPFVGHWEAIDVDGSDIRLTIAGPPNGPFNITWTESYLGFCNREAGIVRGTGWLREGDPNILEADLHLTCFTTGASVDFHVIWIYDPATDTIAYLEPDPVIMTWHRPGKPLPEAWQSIIAHPDEDWVEGWGYPEGTIVSLRIFDPSGMLLFNETQVASYPDWDPNNAWVLFSVGYDLNAGDHLWMTDGKYAKDLIVTNLEITETSLIEQSVYGIAEPGSEIIIEYSPQMFTVTADLEGYWIAAVEGLLPGMPGLASQEDEDGDLTRVVFFVPRLDLRVNYGHDWVESFYEAGHTVGITVTEGDGVTVKATAEMVTDPQDFWGGEAGFQTQPSDWNPGPPDIQPYDWVFAEVDNGQIVQVQIGEIIGEIDLEGDGIQGTVLAPWFSSEVNVECHPWGSPEPAEMKFDTVMPDGLDSYSCTWPGEWDIQPEQDVGVGYFGPDGHWVANAFRVPNPWFTAFPPGVVEGWNWPLGSVIHLTIEDPNTEDAPDFERDGTSVITPWDPNSSSTWVWIEFPGEYEMKPGDKVTLSDGVTERNHIVKNLSITSVDETEKMVTGSSDGYETVILWSWEDPQGRRLEVVADNSGQWMADFDDVGFDLLPGYHVRAEVWDGVNDTAVDRAIPEPLLMVLPW